MARVDLVEYFGPESSLTTRIGNEVLIFLDKGRSVRPDEPIDLTLNLDRVHPFPRQ